MSPGHDSKTGSCWHKRTVWTCRAVRVNTAPGQTPASCPPARLGHLSTSPSLSQGQVGVTGAAGPAGARGQFVSQIMSLLLFWLITDLVGGCVCDWEHWAGLHQWGSFACALNRVGRVSEVLLGLTVPRERRYGRVMAPTPYLWMKCPFLVFYQALLSASG